MKNKDLTKEEVVNSLTKDPHRIMVAATNGSQKAFYALFSIISPSDTLETIQSKSKLIYEVENGLDKSTFTDLDTALDFYNKLP